MAEGSSSSNDDQCSSGMSFCDICIESKAKSETRHSTSKCSHIYCSVCITKHITAKIQENISMITCPDSTCNETLEPHLCRDIISGQVLDRWENALCESSVLASQKIYCPFKDCSVMLVNDDDGVIVRSTECPHCNRLFCAQCEVPWHSELTCDDFQEIKRGGKDDMLMINLAKDQKWIRCPSCRFYVEKVDGCQHITCRCAYQFCYKCGNSWTSCNGGCQRV
ncbi:hypothetical protein MKX03_028377 [Papaver bracteatum]|nr:hypothetical protein MKX03_028377 [Papaver bracteatum]